MSSRAWLPFLVAAIWLGGALAAAGGLADGMGRLARREMSPLPPRLAAGLDLVASCAARLPADDALMLWSASGPLEPESFGFLWMLASYREFPRSVVPMFPLDEISRLEDRRLLDRDLASHLRGRYAALAEESAPTGLLVWSDRPDAPPRCGSSPYGAQFGPVETNAFGVCCVAVGDLP